MRRVATALIAVLALGVAGWGATTRGGASPAGAGGGVTVGSARASLEAIEAEAARLAGGRPRRLAAARRAAADRAIERLWLEGEAAARGLRPAADVALLRGEVADALAGRAPERSARRFARAFDAFHERWRSRTRCDSAYHDPYEDRCGNLAGAAAGTCRWMGEATLCSLSGDRRARWLVVQDAARVRRMPSRARAVALAIEIYSAARAVRAEAARKARRAQAAADAERAAAALEERRARERAAGKARRARAAADAERAAAARSSELAARSRDPHLSEPALAGARAACQRQVADSDPYMFGFGMQDVVGGVEGLIAARAALARGLMGAAQDRFDRLRLRPLVRAVAAGNRELARLAAADAADDQGAVARVLAGLDARTAPERALARGLELGDCLVRPAR